MQISANSVVSIDYTLTNNDGDIIDTSEGREALVYLHGHGNIIPGLEKALEGQAVGTEMSVVVQPAEGYGEYQDELVQDVPKEAFAGVDKIEPGMSFRAESNAGPMMVTVKAVADDTVTVDGNHMLAGEVLNFAVTIKTVRDATEAEISQGMAEVA